MISCNLRFDSMAVMKRASKALIMLIQLKQTFFGSESSSLI